MMLIALRECAAPHTMASILFLDSTGIFRPRERYLGTMRPL